MKRVMGLMYFLVPALLVFVSCDKDEKNDVYAVLGTISITEDSTIIETDADERLWIKAGNGVGSSIQDDDRVYAYFIMLDDPTPVGIDYVIEINQIKEILCKPVIVITDENADSIGNDPLLVDEIWLSKKYLNLTMRFYGNNQVHMFNLVRPEGEIPTDTVDLEIRHNDNGDISTYALDGFISFKLESLQNDMADSVVLHVTASEYDDRTYEKYFTYKY